MKIKEVMRTIEKLNVLRDALSIEKAYVLVYIDDVEYDKELHTLKELTKLIKSEFIDDFYEVMMNADYIKTYNNTLSAKIICNGIVQKIELFVDC